MKSGLATRVDRISARIAKRNGKATALLICTLFDTCDDDVTAVTLGTYRFERLPGETLDALLERARTATGFAMWIAEYTESVGGCIGG